MPNHFVRRQAFVVAVGFSFVWSLVSASGLAAAPRVLPAGQTPKDVRLGDLKDLDGYFPFTPAKSPAEWNRRAEQVRRQILVSQGLWPMPTATPAQAVIHGKVERDGFTVERVYLQSYPGHYVTGSLFRPKNKAGKLPGILTPHGHWANGRFYDAGEAQVKRDIADGGERYEQSGRYPLQAICAQLARMGCVVFFHDMLGAADSQQIPGEISHGFKAQRPNLDAPDGWGFFSTQAEVRLQSIMGLQTYNSVRVLDWFSSLPDVDPARIGVTGGSGGGTQTFILAAIDPRPAVAFPAVMVSTAMQGGCTCENASLLRVGTGNIEFAALAAPRPLGMTAANDWTREIETKGLPELKQHYAMLGVPDRVMARAFLQFGHNYNYVSRSVMYAWMNEHLGIGQSEPIVENDFQPLSMKELTVWTDGHAKPPAGEGHERELTRTMDQDAQRQLAALAPRDAASLAKFRQVVGGAIDAIVGRQLPPAGSVEHEMLSETDRGSYKLFTALLRNKDRGEELPVAFLLPKSWNRRVTIWLDGAGKDGLFGSDGGPIPAVAKLLDAGVAVMGADLLFQGEFLPDGKPPTETRAVANGREAAGYTLGYNHSLFAQRVHDILSMISFCKHFELHPIEKIYLAAFNGAGPWAAAALAQSAGAVDRAAIDTAGFRFTQLKSIRDVNLLPGGAKYGDLPGILSLAAPTELWLAGEGKESPAIVKAAYSAAGNAAGVHSGPSDAAAAAIWLVR